jgi:hypothetical protein
MNHFTEKQLQEADIRLDEIRDAKVEKELSDASKYEEPSGSKQRVEEQVRIALDGHPDSQLWGGDGLLAATMRCVYGYEKLERELAEYQKCFEESQQNLTIEVEEVERLKLELTAVTEQRDGLKQAVDCASDLLASITEQRDRLAEALKKLADCDWVITLPDRMDAVRTIANEALQSLTQNVSCPPTGATEGRLK